jgi:EAL domain-containing protein (putative c-di-GMP-specific phosphodiesterase class I)/GGDEF domain-containing protein/CBS domain-containing protein
LSPKQSKQIFPQLYAQLCKIIETSDIQTVFQPIISLRDGAILGYEALSRGPSDTPLQNPDALFSVASHYNRLWDLEQLCRTRALEFAYSNKKAFKLFLNVNPSIIHDEKFKHGFTKEYLRNFNIDPTNIFFEISEKTAVEDLNGFKKTIEHYKSQNYKIAIDDAGAGYSGLNLITDVHPHYIKLDMKLIRNINKDGFKKALVKSLYDFCHLSEILLIAEGIETEEELKTLIDIGVHYGQGYFIQTPQPKILDIGPQILTCIQSENAKKNYYYHDSSSYFVGNLCRENKIVSPDDLAESVYNLFACDETLFGVTVVNSMGKTVGITTKTRIDHIMSGKYGFSLHFKHSISQIMDTNPLMVDFSTPISTVSKLAMSRANANLYDFIVIERNSKYCGVVTIKDLLEKTMELEVLNARHLNPLSGLPGNLLIQQALENCIASGANFTILYVDIDNFKAYNDVYGFGNGDQVICFMAKLLEDMSKENCFIGHIGGDDFIIIVYSHETTDLCQSLIKRFDTGIRAFYSEKDLNRGFVISKNRQGDNDQFSIMTISIAGVSNHDRCFFNVNEVTQYASVLKKKCKMILKSWYVIN